MTVAGLPADTDVFWHCGLNDISRTPVERPSDRIRIVVVTTSLQLRFEFDSTAVRRAFDCLSDVIKVTATKPLIAVTPTYLFI